MMFVLLGMWYGMFPTYHGLQRMSVFCLTSPFTAMLYDLAVIAPWMLSSALTANFPSRKPICANACGAIFGAYFVSTLNISAESGPTFGSTFANSLSIQR